MNLMQCTIRSEASVSGAGLHTGNTATLTFHPAETGSGICFRRMDLPQQPIIKAVVENVISTDRGTVIGTDQFSISTIEHVMSALSGLGIDNVLIDVDSNEVPILDGSALPIVGLLKDAGVREQDAERNFLGVDRKMEFTVPETGASYSIEPSEKYSLEVEVNYKDVIGFGRRTLDDIRLYDKEIAPCRTFVFLKEILPLFERNLIKGGDLRNAVVFIEKDVRQSDLDRVMDAIGKPRVKIGTRPFVNETELRFDDEPVRHKMLDLIGDMALIGKPLKAHVKASCPGHRSNVEFVRYLYSNNIR